VLREFESIIKSLVLVPSNGGRFEVSVNDQLVYSKLHTHRHVESGEINPLIRNLLKEAV
jgi:selenoprotein W-related protein